MRRFALLPVLAAAACGLLSNNNITIPYDLEPQEFKHNFSDDFKGNTGTFPSVKCTSDAECTAIPAGMLPSLPAGSTIACDVAGTKQCAASYILRLPVPVDLSKQTSFPQSVAKSSVINDVQVSAVHYWTQMNSDTFDTPPIDLYVGGQSAMKESDTGVAKLGTLPAIAKMDHTTCTMAKPCSMPLTDGGKHVLGTLAKDFKTPFTVLLVARLTVHGNEMVPGGQIDLMLRPTIAFVIPL